MNISSIKISDTFANSTPRESKMKECRDCWHNYHCPLPQEGYDYDPDTCPYNPDNEK